MNDSNDMLTGLLMQILKPRPQASAIQLGWIAGNPETGQLRCTSLEEQDPERAQSLFTTLTIMAGTAMLLEQEEVIHTARVLSPPDTDDALFQFCSIAAHQLVETANNTRISIFFDEEKDITACNCKRCKRVAKLTEFVQERRSMRWNEDNEAASENDAPILFGVPHAATVLQRKLDFLKTRNKEMDVRGLWADLDDAGRSERYNVSAEEGSAILELSRLLRGRFQYESGFWVFEKQ